MAASRKRKNANFLMQAKDNNERVKEDYDKHHSRGEYRHGTAYDDMRVQ